MKSLYLKYLYIKAYASLSRKVKVLFRFLVDYFILLNSMQHYEAARNYEYRL